MRIYLVVGLSLLILPLPSFADEGEPAPDPHALYDEAIRAMDAGDHAKACPMLEQVTRILPEGLGAKFTLAECFEEQKRFAHAYHIFVSVEKAAGEKGQKERSQKAGARAAALRPRLGQVRFVGSAALVSGYGVHVEIDGIEIASTELADLHYVDPGTRQIVVFVKGMRRGEHFVDITTGAVQEVPLRELLKLGPRETAAESPLPATEPTQPIEPRPQKPIVKRNFPIWQVVMGGLGFAAVGVGVGFKLDSVTAEQSLVDHCGEDLLCPRNTGYDPADDNARKNRSFGLFMGMTGVGAIALGTATIGMIRRANGQTPNTSLTVQPIFSPAHGGVVFSGRF